MVFSDVGSEIDCQVVLACYYFLWSCVLRFPYVGSAFD